MNAAPDDFEGLRRLLALKRHEQPPPGYFQQLSRRISARLEDLEPASEDSLWQQILSALTVKPVFASAFGMLVCGFVLLGIDHSLKIEQERPSPWLSLNSSWNISPPTLANHETEQASFSFYPARGSSSTNPVMNAEPASALFNGFKLKLERVSYSPGQTY